jgi:O-antigen ligase
MRVSPQIEQTPLGVSIRSTKATLAYRALVCFSLIYFIRPEDFIPALNIVPLGKVAGGLSLLALVFGVKSKDRGKFPLECKILLALLVQMLLTIPFAFWRGGAFDTVVNKFSKGVIAAFLIVLVVTKLSELRRLLYIQSAAVAGVTVASLAVQHTIDGRLMGIQKGILENPNDLAINIAINFPLCMAFMFAAKGGLRKVAWAFGLMCMLYAVVATYSRSGMIAMLITAAICVWEFGVKGQRILLVLSAGIIGIVALGIVLITPKYFARVETMIHDTPEASQEQGTLLSHAQGSVGAREQLLKDSLKTALHHPLFGVGPGNFPAVAGGWHVAHNTYTEIAAEAGFPAVFLFLWLLVASWRKIRRVQKLPAYALNGDIRLWSAALAAGLAAYIAGSAFASTEYNLFPYFMVGYICALYNIATNPIEETTSGTGRMREGGKEQIGYGGNGEREIAWSR